jgi:hypothetical protein
MEDVTLTCRRCHGPGPFYKAYADHHNHVCKACASAIVAQSRNNDPARLLAYRWYNALRRRGIHCKQLSDSVRSILQQWGQNVQNLCVFPFFRDVPLHEPWHCVVITCHEARALSHMRSEARVHSHFPLHVRQHMECARQALTVTSNQSPSS